MIKERIVIKKDKQRTSRVMVGIISMQLANPIVAFAHTAFSVNVGSGPAQPNSFAIDHSQSRLVQHTPSPASQHWPSLSHQHLPAYAHTAALPAAGAAANIFARQTAGSNFVNLQSLSNQASWSKSNLLQASPNFLRLVESDSRGQKFDLDLSSTKDLVKASSILGLSNVVINVGGTRLHVSGDSILTDAEWAAASQVVASGHQALVLDKNGAAVGGSLKLTPALVSEISGLTIPRGVTVLDKVSGSVEQPIILADGLINSGRLTFTGGGSNTGLEIAAGSILNSVSGVISSDSNITLASAGSITNAGSVVAQNGILNLLTANLINSGLVKSSAGNINITNSPGSNSLTINNTSGKVSASDTLNIAVSQSTNIPSINNPSLQLTGGDFSGKAINLTNPGGDVSANVGTFSGPVNVAGATASVGDQHGNLDINQSKVTGDPVYFSAGNLTLNVSNFNTAGDIFVGLAGGDITSDGPGTIDTRSTALGAAGGDIVLAAGVTFTTGAKDVYAITGASTSGGSLNLKGVDLITNGGNVTLAANAGTTSGSGAITIGNITTSGDANHPDAGNVTVTAANTTTIGNILATGLDMSTSTSQGGAGGNVTINVNSTQPVTIGNIDTHGGSGGGLPEGTSGDGGHGGDGGAGYPIPPDVTGGGGTGGDGGQSVPTFNIGIPYGLGGAGGVSDLPGQAGTQGGPNAGKGGDGGNGGTTLASNPGTAGLDGKSGTDPAKGADGGAGSNGGDGGSVTISTKGNLNIGIVQTFGGRGGTGSFGGAGGAGGTAGQGGYGAVGQNQPGTNKSAAPGQVGGNAGDGGAGGAAVDGADGGDGGKGGDGGAGGDISLTVGGNLIFTRPAAIAYSLDSSGGTAGVGGVAGPAGAGGSGGNGNAGGPGGNGGVGGSQFHQTGSYPNGDPYGTLTPFSPGNGGNGGNGGAATDGGGGGSGGTGGDGGAGGNGGNITIQATQVSVSIINGPINPPGLYANVSGGAGGQGDNGGRGGFGGAGGIGGAAGGGGFPGVGFTYNIPNNATVYPTPPNPPPGQMGKAGQLAVGGKGGDGGDAGDGGNGGAAGFSGVFTMISNTPQILQQVVGTTYAPAGQPASTAIIPGGPGGSPGYFNPAISNGGPGGLDGNFQNRTATGMIGNPGSVGIDGNFTLPTVVVLKSAPQRASGAPEAGAILHNVGAKGVVSPLANNWLAGAGASAHFLATSSPFTGSAKTTLDAAVFIRGQSSITTDINGAAAEQTVLSTINSNMLVNTTYGALPFGSSSSSSSSGNDPISLSHTAVPSADDPHAVTAIRLPIYSTVVGAPVGWPTESAINSFSLAGAEDRKSLAIENPIPVISDKSCVSEGVALLSPDRATEISTRFGTLHVAAGALVLIVGDNQSISVYDLHDDRAASVCLETKGHKFTLAPGKHITLARASSCQSSTADFSPGDFSASNKLPFVSYRSVNYQQIDQELASFCADYDVSSLMASFAPFKQMLFAGDLNARRVAQKAVKTWAIMSQLSSGARPYQQMISPAQVAILE